MSGMSMRSKGKMFHAIKYIGEVYCNISGWLKMTATFTREEVDEEIWEDTIFAGK